MAYIKTRIYQSGSFIGDLGGQELHLDDNVNVNFQNGKMNLGVKKNSANNINTTVVEASSYNVNNDDFYIGVNYNGATTINLPIGSNGRMLKIKDESGQAATNNIGIVPNGVQKIDGYTSVAIGINYGALTLIFRGSEWHIV